MDNDNLISTEDKAFQAWIKTDPNVQEWRKQFIEEYGVEPIIENSGYDYKGAFRAGIKPEPNPNHILKSGEPAYHWGSIGLDGEDLKSIDHPTRWKSDFMKKTGLDPDVIGMDELTGKQFLDDKNGPWSKFSAPKSSAAPWDNFVETRNSQPPLIDGQSNNLGEKP